MKPHSKNYDRLIGEERFRLYIAAMSRCDHAEAAALGDTCPTYNYSMRDWSFHRRVDASLQLMTAFSLELAPHIAIIEELECQLEHFACLIELLTLSGIEAAIEAHWLATDPKGTPEKRLERRLPMPDIHKLMRGAAGVAFEGAQGLIEAQRSRRKQEIHAAGAILAGFDQFAREYWAINGQEAIAAHDGLLDQLEPYYAEIRRVEPDKKAQEEFSKSLSGLWKSLLR